MYVAVEYTDDGEVNDSGPVCGTKREAWEVVDHVFSAKHTKILDVRKAPAYKVLERDISFTPVKED